MRNLQLFQEERVNLKLNPEDEEEAIVAGTYDSDHGQLFLASNACNVYSLNCDGQVMVTPTHLANVSRLCCDIAPEVMSKKEYDGKVRDVLRVLQGYPISILPWNPAGQCFGDLRECCAHATRAMERELGDTRLFSSYVRFLKIY